MTKWLKEFDTDRGRSITLRHLLTHTSGLMGNQQNVGTLAETVKEIADRPVALRRRKHGHIALGLPWWEDSSRWRRVNPSRHS